MPRADRQYKAPLDTSQFKVMKLWHGLGGDADKQWRNVMNRYPRERNAFSSLTPAKRDYLDRTYGESEANEWLSTMSGTPRLGV